MKFLRSSWAFNLWLPDWSTLDLRVVFLTMLCAALAFAYHWSITKILLLSAVLGYALLLLFPMI